VLRSAVTKPVATWIEEALTLFAAGMPVNLFSLVFNGRQDNLRKVVDVVKEDATWQAALEICVRRKSMALPTPGPGNFFAGFRGYAVHIADAFSQKLAHILAGKSFIRFSGVAEEMPCVEDTIRDNHNCVTHEDWDRKWAPILPKNSEMHITMLTGDIYWHFEGYSSCLEHHGH